MCIGFPGKVLSIDEDNFAVIEIGGTTREVCLDIVDEPVRPGTTSSPTRLCHPSDRRGHGRGKAGLPERADRP